MFKELALKKISRALNKILATDWYVLAQFATLEAKTLRIILLKTPFDFLVSFHKQGIDLKPAIATDQATVQLSGTPSNLLRFAKTKAHTNMLMNQQIQIKGDLDLLMHIRKIEQQLEIDWEGLLAEYFGDFLANRLCLFLKNTKEKMLNHAQLVKMDTLDYLHDGLQCLPRAEEVTHFYRGVRTLRQDIDRLEARWKQKRRRQ